ncbi:hypothetical protein ACFSJW_02225 [Flavobacterium artemisiae]|uniref:Uncharacterized protein n=1 Tax=Flavobacterium artemisiae TaxID=2126556 RepID=A0ABW4HL43_9FLAO
MKTDKQQSENSIDENTNQNANSSYSGSGSMQPGGSTGEAGRLNDYSEEEEKTKEQIENENKSRNTEGKSIDEATDPSKLDKI